MKWASSVKCRIMSSKGLGPRPGEVDQDGLKVLHLWCHSQKISNLQPKKFVPHCQLQDLPSHLSLWIALYHFRCQSYACAKPYAIQLFQRKMLKTYRMQKSYRKVCSIVFNNITIALIITNFVLPTPNTTYSFIIYYI